MGVQEGIKEKQLRSFRRITIDLLDKLGLKFRLQRYLFNREMNRRGCDPDHVSLIHPLARKNHEVDWLLIAPHVPEARQPWRIGGGNYFFEILESARELAPDKTIKLHQVKEGDVYWKSGVISSVLEENPRNILLQVEAEPTGESNWTIDLLVVQLRRAGWKGRVVLLSYDSVFPLHLFRIDRITRSDSNCEIVTIDRDITGLYRGRARNVSEVFLPISLKSFEFLSSQASPKFKPFSLTFIGALYGYRVDELEKLSSKNLKIRINPHITEGSTGSYLEYIRCLSESRITLNFSRAHVFDIPQLKTRILEASLFGCVVATDETLHISKYFKQGAEFLVFETPEDLESIYSNLDLMNPPIEVIAEAAKTRARSIMRESFWNPIL